MVETTVRAPVVWMETPAIMMQQRLFRTVRSVAIPRALKWIAREIASWPWIVRELVVVL